MNYSFLNGANAPKRTQPTRRTRRTLNVNPDFPHVRNVEEALVELGRRHWEFMFKKFGYTERAYHALLVQHGFEYKDGRPITLHTVACTLNNLTRPEYGSRMDKLKHKWGRNGERDVLQYAPAGKVAEALDADDDFFAEVFRGHPHFSAWRLMSLWHQNRRR